MAGSMPILMPVQKTPVMMVGIMPVMAVAVIAVAVLMAVLPMNRLNRLIAEDILLLHL